MRRRDGQCRVCLRRSRLESNYIRREKFKNLRGRELKKRKNVTRKRESGNDGVRSWKSGSGRAKTGGLDLRPRRSEEGPGTGAGRLTPNSPYFFPVELGVGVAGHLLPVSSMEAGP